MTKTHFPCLNIVVLIREGSYGELTPIRKTVIILDLNDPLFTGFCQDLAYEKISDRG